MLRYVSGGFGERSTLSAATWSADEKGFLDMSIIGSESETFSQWREA